VAPFSTVSSLIGELLIISLVAVFAKWARLPYTIALVGAGLLLTLSRPFPLHLQLTPELLFLVLLPALLFEAGIHLPLQVLRRNLSQVVLLAGPGMLLTAVFVGYGVHFCLGMALPAALVFGALISATDPISVLALFRRLNAPKNLAVVVEGESLFNDGAAVVLFNILLTFAQGGAISLGKGVAHFGIEAFGGLALGAALAWLMWRVHQQIDDHLVEVTLSTVLAYGSYLVAQHFHLSGVMAVIAAGLIYGRYAMTSSMSLNTRISLTHSWEYLGFLGNSLVFLLIGTQVDVAQLSVQAWPIAVAFAVVLVSRGLALVLLAPLLRLDWKWLLVVFWAGLRGSIAMALAMALTLPERDLILALTFGVVVLSVFLQGLSMPALLRWLKIGDQSPQLLEYETYLGELLAQQRALVTLRQGKGRYHLSPSVYEEFEAPISKRIEELKAKLEQSINEQPAVQQEQRSDMEKLIQSSRRQALREALASGLISDSVYESLRDCLGCETEEEG